MNIKTTPPSIFRWGRFSFLQQLFVLCLATARAFSQSPTLLVCDELTESSGVCVGESGVIWTHNDSGGKPVIYGFSDSGRLLSKVTVNGARAVDWEDICSFRVGKNSYLAIADVGDNLAKRKQVEIYVVPEPKLTGPAPTAPTELSVRCAVTLSVTYDSGPVNCEAIGYDPVRKTFVLPSKEPTRCQLFEVDAKKLVGRVSATAKATQSLFLPLATGADISPDGQHLVLCSYGPGWLLSRTPDNDQWAIETPKLFKLPARRQGEAICFTADSRRLLLTSEFAPTPLHSIACPGLPKTKDSR
ncbi:MAG: hypothetical protein Aurels2KO_23270 [Aureliella sp.]